LERFRCAFPFDLGQCGCILFDLQKVFELRSGIEVFELRWGSFRRGDGVFSRVFELRWGLRMRTLRLWIAVGFIAISPACTASAVEKHWFKTYIDSDGGCGNTRFWFRPGGVLFSRKDDLNRGKIDVELFGKPLLKWTDEDITTAVGIYRDCIDEAGSYSTSGDLFERMVREIVAGARSIDDQRKAPARSAYQRDAEEYRQLINFNDRYTGVEAFERAYAAYRHAFDDNDLAGMTRERALFLKELGVAKDRKQLLTQQSKEISGYQQELSELATAVNRESLAEFADQQMTAKLDELKEELHQLSQIPPAKRGDISAELEIIDTRLRNTESAVEHAKEHKRLLTGQSVQVAKDQQTLASKSATIDREGLSKFVDEQTQIGLGELNKQLQQLSQIAPAKRGDIAVDLAMITARLEDIEKAIASARETKGRAEKTKQMLVENEGATKRVLDAATRADLKAAFDEQFVMAVNKLIDRFRELESVELWAIREKQEDILAATRKLQELQQQISEAQARYDEARTLDDVRQSVLQRAATIYGEFSRSANREKLSTDGVQVIADLKSELDALAGLDEKPLLARPDYRETLTAAEETLDKIAQFKAEIDQISGLSSALRSFTSMIDGRGRHLLDRPTSVQLTNLTNSVKALNAAKIPLPPESSKQVADTDTKLQQLERTVDGVMDREEKQLLVRTLPARSGAWQFKFEIDKIADEESAKALADVQGAQARYQLAIVCGSRGPVLLISTFEIGGAAGKKIPWNVDDIGAPPYERIRLRIDSQRPFTALFNMRSYGNQGQVDITGEFDTLARSSRLVFGDIFADDQVEVATAFPAEFSRLCHCSRVLRGDGAHILVPNLAPFAFQAGPFAARASTTQAQLSAYSAEITFHRGVRQEALGTSKKSAAGY
jgi:hypothetical protein